MESQLHHLHRHQVLVLPTADGASRHSPGTDLGNLLRHSVLHTHLGSGAVRQELPDRDPLRQSRLLHLRAHLLRPTVRGHGQVLQQHPDQHDQGGVAPARGRRRINRKRGGKLGGGATQMEGKIRLGKKKKLTSGKREVRLFQSWAEVVWKGRGVVTWHLTPPFFHQLFFFFLSSVGVTKWVGTGNQGVVLQGVYVVILFVFSRFFFFLVFFWFF